RLSRFRVRGTRFEPGEPGLRPRPGGGERAWMSLCCRIVSYRVHLRGHDRQRGSETRSAGLGWRGRPGTCEGRDRVRRLLVVGVVVVLLAIGATGLGVRNRTDLPTTGFTVDLV